MHCILCTLNCALFLLHCSNFQSFYVHLSPYFPAKFSILHLCVSDILRKDLKVLSRDDRLRIGISSVTCAAEDFLSKSNAREMTLAFASEKSLSVIAIMFIHTKDDTAIRELAVGASDTSLLQSFVSHLQQVDDLQLKPEGSPTGSILVFSQGSAKVSRKVLSPHVTRFLFDA